jgi:putative CocE/NonD family hydrolase
MRRSLLLVAVALLVLVPATARARSAPAPAPVRESGYITTSDGVRLRYTVVHPAGPGPWPTLFEYSGYDPGTNPDASHVRRFVEQDGGYAYIGVNIRGTGCSEGTFDFFQPREALDGADVIAWIRSQPWSNGLVGMIGKSYPGITQLFVAAQQPEGLAAIAPGHFFSDAYRDIARPGGVLNYGFSSLWSFVGRPSYEFESSPGQVAAGDPECLRGSLQEVGGLATNPFVQLLQHPHDDALFRERSPETYLADLQVPMLATLSWQDEQLGSRQTDLLAQLDDLGRTNWWATLTNGDHGMARTRTELDDLERFYDHFLKGEDNGWEARPRVLVWWEAGRDGGARAPGWTTALDHWSEAHRQAAGELAPWALPLRAGGALGDAGEATGATSFTYLPGVGSQGIGNPSYSGVGGLPDFYLWDQAPPPGTAAAFTTAPLPEDRTLLGSASLDLWLTATGPDVDLQATITEVRPDGQEEFVQQGWLKVSQRALDEDRSTVLRPYQTHAAEDVAMLTPGAPVLARLEVFPFGHVFRAGSRLRVWVESPTVLPQLWAFAPFPTPARVTILHDAEHPSQIVLPVVPNDAERVTALPECDLLIRQPCRPDPLASSGASGPSGPSGPSAPAGPSGPPTTLAPGTIDAGSPAGPGSGAGPGGATGALARTGAGDAVLLPAGVALVLAVALRRRLRTS